MKSFVGVVVRCLAHCWVLGQQRDVVCFWFPSHDRTACVWCFSGVCPLVWGWVLVGAGRGGVGVWLGLLFENYIVNASIFYKKAISLRK